MLLLTRVGVLSFAAGLFAWYALLLPVKIDAASFYAGVSTITVLIVAALPCMASSSRSPWAPGGPR